MSEIGKGDLVVVYVDGKAVKVHVTRTDFSREGVQGVFGHSTDHCDESGCNGHEQYWGTALSPLSLLALRNWGK
jgi:hypothetical protein